MFTSFSPIISAKRLAAATHSVRPEMPKYSTAWSSNGLGPRSEADVVLDLPILTKRSSAVRIQRTSAGLFERRTICYATKPLTFVTRFPFAVLRHRRDNRETRQLVCPDAAASRNTSRVSRAQRCQENTLARSIPTVARLRR